ncbi:Response regulator PleD [Anatilimnocola aggregata]|uniref:diguanylate cyclase n=1 Tax=Anatilimnocola aggregata TaxID=2528021 RepID=A0A517Y6Z5_9BACT|nr:GGDEF domain-containing protein [Anatilimnocola aggregata]QDU25912.1 Response regulator PleD [Anatilimnocola aggregata]
MTTLIVEAAVALTAASAGAAAGWCFRRSTEAKAKASPEHAPMTSVDSEQDAESNRQAAKQLLTQVHALTTKVSSQVGEHNLRVQAINDQLNSGEALDLDTINSAVNRLVEANAWMQQQLDSAESKLESQARLIESHVNEARTDALTCIANRRAFDEEMQRCLDLLRIERVPSCVMMIDVDFFKKFNDTHGHKAGDEVLRHVARALKQAAGGSGLVCRYGGEEFAVIMSGLHAKDALPIAERCRAAIGTESIAYEGKTLHVNASAGLSEFTSRDTMETVLERSDEALYASKRGGRNCGHWHNGESFVPFVQAMQTAPEEAKPAAAAVATETSAKPVAAGPTLTDSTTGLSTREALRDDLQRRLASMQREPHHLSLLVVQVDRLLDWTTKGGEEACTMALRTVAIALRGVTREMDHAARFEDDAFAVAIHGSSIEAAIEVAQRLRHSLQSARPKLAGTPSQITLSIGICEAMPGDDSARMFLRSQAAQNTSANLGGNQIATHDGKRIRLFEESQALA